MSTDSEATDNRMEKINVRVPVALLERLDEEWERRGFSSKSEAIRAALRDWLNPPAELSDEFLEELAESRDQVARGETMTAEEARERLGLDD